jgi:hypothetical protein
MPVRCGPRHCGQSAASNALSIAAAVANPNDNFAIDLLAGDMRFS